MMPVPVPPPAAAGRSAKYGWSWASLQVMRAVGSYVNRRCLGGGEHGE